MPNTPVRPALSLGAVTVADAESIARTIDSAEAGLHQAIAQVRVMLRTRDLSSIWNPDADAWIPEFEATASRIAHLQSALRVLADEPELVTGVSALVR